MFSDINIRKLVVWLLLILAISLTLGTAGLFSEGLLPIGAESKNYVKVDEEKSFSVDGLDNINVKTVSSNINIIPVESNEIRVHFHGYKPSKQNTPELVSEKDSSSLNIEVKHTEKFLTLFSFNFYDVQLDIFVPKAYVNDITISTVSGNMNLKNVKFGRSTLKSVSGNLYASKVETSLSFSTTSGEAYLDYFSGNIDINSVSGGLTASYSSFNNDISVTTTSGDGKIKLPENAQFNIDFQSISGDFYSDFPMTMENRSGNKTSAKVGNGDNRLYFKSVSGDLQIVK